MTDTATAKRVLGVDTALRTTGVAIVEARGAALAAVEFGIIRNAPALALSRCLLELQRGVAALIERAQPGAVAIEGVFFSRNVKTTLALGEARGAVIAACAAAGVPVFEYAPRRVKQALVGHGGAEKEQVRKMVMSILGLREEPQEDAADALALAVCHLNSRTGYAALAPQEI